MSHNIKEQRAVASVVITVVIAIPLWCYVNAQASTARQKAESELAARTGFDHWWHNKDPEKAEETYYLLGVVGTVVGLWLGYLLSPLTLEIVESVNTSRLAASAKREQEKLHESMRQQDVENQQQARRMSLAQSKQEIVTRLGSIDQFIRVYRGESNSDRRIMTLQAAQGELTSLNAKLVSGEIDAESLRDADVLECVKETLVDLSQADLAGDRLFRDLRRLFGRRNGYRSEEAGALKKGTSDDPVLSAPPERKSASSRH